MTFNTISLNRVAASVIGAMGLDVPAHMGSGIPNVEALVKRYSTSGLAQRVFMLNPDALGQWLYLRYTEDFYPVTARTQLALPIIAAFPPKTPVCFATMYTGVDPAVHGIQQYERPVVTQDSLFDVLVRAGKRVAIVAVEDDTMALIWQGKKIDYYIESDDEAVFKRSMELINANRHDFICAHLQAYDDSIHITEPESPTSLVAMKGYMRHFAEISDTAETAWASYDTLIGFATDHGIHKTIFGFGDHYADIPEDMNIMHFYGFQPAN
jgi:hypothetical protein